MYIITGKNIEVYLFFFCVYCFEILEKNGIFLEILLSISKSEAGGVLSLKFPEFEAGCAYKLVAYKKKNVYAVCFFLYL